MSAIIIDGKSLAACIREESRQRIAKLGLKPGLGVILVGHDPASHLYVSLKERACADAGIRMEKRIFPAHATESEIIEAVDELNFREDIHAILVQLPLPAVLDESRVIAAINPKKDVDGFHPRNLEAFMNGDVRIVPGLVAGIMELLNATGEELVDKRAAIVANSDVFQAPIARALERAGAFPSFVRPDDKDLRKQVAAAGILIVAVGRPGFITGGMIKPGAIVIDVGTNRVDGRTTGDVDGATAVQVAGYLTPVPGGVGPMTVAMLIRNAVMLAEKNA